MATKSECCLCNPDAGADCLCPDCIDKAAGYDDLHMRMTVAGIGLRRILPMLEFATPPHAMVALLLEQQCKPEMDALDAQDARLEQWQRDREAETASLHRDEVQPKAEAARMLHGAMELTL